MSSIYILNIEKVDQLITGSSAMFFTSMKKAINHGLWDVEIRGGILDQGFTGTKTHQSLFFTGSDNINYYVWISKRTVF